jgi:hypothetical protein
MDIKELLDDESLDPKKFFDEKEYVTLLVNREGFNKKENDIADLLESLCSSEIKRVEAEEIFSKLKTANAAKMLVDEISKAKTLSQKAKLCAACWESGLDFTSDFLFFTELAVNKDFNLSMEAYTVVENIEGTISEHELTKALEIALQGKEANEAIREDLIRNIKSRII